MATKEPKTQKKKKRGLSAMLVIILAFIVALCIYNFIFGNPANFVGGDNANHPLQGNMLGTIFKGGFVVPILLTWLLTVIVLAVERLIAISRCTGKGNLDNFVVNVKEKLEVEDFEGAVALCDKQKGAVAAVTKVGVETYD